jgi:hypothetical protein
MSLLVPIDAQGWPNEVWLGLARFGGFNRLFSVPANRRPSFPVPLAETIDLPRSGQVLLITPLSNGNEVHMICEGKFEYDNLLFTVFTPRMRVSAKPPVDMRHR